MIQFLTLCYRMGKLTLEQLSSLVDSQTITQTQYQEIIAAK